MARRFEGVTEVGATEESCDPRPFRGAAVAFCAMACVPFDRDTGLKLAIARVFGEKKAGLFWTEFVAVCGADFDAEFGIFGRSFAVIAACDAFIAGADFDAGRSGAETPMLAASAIEAAKGDSPSADTF